MGWSFVVCGPRILRNYVEKFVVLNFECNFLPFIIFGNLRAILGDTEVDLLYVIERDLHNHAPSIYIYKLGKNRILEKCGKDSCVFAFTSQEKTKNVCSGWIRSIMVEKNGLVVDVP